MLLVHPVLEPQVEEKIPKEALPVALILRRDVPRPTVLPVWWQPEPNQTYKVGALRWTNRKDLIRRDVAGRVVAAACAMGLHPAANDPSPYEDFLDLPAYDVRAFVYWFDSQTDAQATVDAIWPL